MSSTYNGTTAVDFPIDDCTRIAYEVLLAIFGVTYAATFAGLVAIGFGPIGITAGSIAAFVQSSVFGAAVPAGGWFATMTSLGMTGGFHWVASGTAFMSTAIVKWLEAAGLFETCKQSNEQD